MANKPVSAVVPCTPPTPSPHSIPVYPRHTRPSNGSDDVKLLHTLNLKLQLKVNEQEAEISRLRDEVSGHSRKTSLYESLTKDLATLRVQLDKTSVSLLKKCEANDKLKKEIKDLKAERNNPTSAGTELAEPKINAPKKFNLQTIRDPRTGRSRFVPEDVSDSDSDCSSTPRRSVNRPSMGSCGNLSKQISREETVPSCLKMYKDAPLRNKVLLKAHSMKSASTESLESVGRKSLKANQAPEAKKAKVIGKPKASSTPLNRAPPPVPCASTKPAPRSRLALGECTNGRTIRVPNGPAVKRSNTTSSIRTKPVFK